MNTAQAEDSRIQRAQFPNLPAHEPEIELLWRTNRLIELWLPRNAFEIGTELPTMRAELEQGKKEASMDTGVFITKGAELAESGFQVRQETREMKRKREKLADAEMIAAYLAGPKAITEELLGWAEESPRRESGENRFLA